MRGAGSLDPTFGNGGVTVTSVAGTNGIVNSVLLQSDGEILVYVGGEAVLRYTITGALDTSFGSDGIAVLSTPIAGGLALQANGQIVIGGVVTPSTGGAALGVERLNTNGTQDTSFGSGGLAMVNLGRAPLESTAALAILVDTQLDPISRRARLTPTSRGSLGLSPPSSVLSPAIRGTRLALWRPAGKQR
ncbi:MAG: hypothetical protein WBW81_07800 [Methylocella sp.]